MQKVIMKRAGHLEGREIVLKATELPLILALDTNTVSEAENILDEIGGSLQYLKIGHRLFAQGGRDFLSSTIDKGFDVFLDLKLHDIPNTVKIALEEYLDLGIWAITLHTAGGKQMLEYAMETKSRLGSSTNILGVTVLTSHDDQSWEGVTPGCGMKEALMARSVVCKDVGLDGLVCSPLDLSVITDSIAKDLMKVVPGIRLKKGTDDQKRIMSPFDAIKGGADYLVVGRPILSAHDKREAVRIISDQIQEGLSWKNIQ